MRRRAVLAAVGAAFCAGSVVAVAADDPQLIVACVDSAGSPRIVGSAADCNSTRETSLTWNAAGPAGAPGPAGAQGPAGPAGAPGASPGSLGTVQATAPLDPKDLSAADQKAFKAAGRGLGKGSSQKVVTAKTAAVATCDPDPTPAVPGACVLRLRAVDYLACPKSHPVVSQHSVTPYPAGYPTGTDLGQSAPAKPPYAGYAFNQQYAFIPLVGLIEGGFPYDKPALDSVSVPVANGKAPKEGVAGVIESILETATGVPGYTVTVYVRKPGYKPVTQAFGVRERLTCERKSGARK